MVAKEAAYTDAEDMDGITLDVNLCPPGPAPDQPGFVLPRDLQEESFEGDGIFDE